MIHVLHLKNPLDINDADRYSHQEDASVRAWLDRNFGEGFDFPLPTICVVNGKAKMRAEWGNELEDGDIVTFVTLAGDGGFLLVAIIVAIAIAAVIFFFLKPPALGAGGFGADPDPVFSLRGQKNQARLGAPIEVPYGRNRLWPSYAARSYNVYENNDQYQYQLLCLGQGYYDVEQILIDETDIDDFEEITYQVYQPGQLVELFPDRVDTSLEVADSEMFGPNEDDYEGPIGPFTVNPPYTETNQIQMDIEARAGLYSQDDEGDLRSASFRVEFEYRRINDVGTPLGDWTFMVSFSDSAATTQVQRWTVIGNVPLGRYEVRGHRTSNASKSHLVSDTITWTSLRAFLPSVKNYGSVTLLAIRARATNNLNDQASNKISVIATRKLPIFNFTTKVWSAPTATRSIVWAFCDVIRSVYGGNAPTTYLDMDKLEDLHLFWEANNRYFDWIFDQRSTVWDAISAIARVGRAVAVPMSNKMAMKRDEEETLPVCIFTSENIIKGSFQWTIKGIPEDAPDGLKIEYIDSRTWKPEIVDCLHTGDTNNSPEEVKFYGISNRQHAYEEGMVMRLRKLFIREAIQFSTTMVGMVPSFGDFIYVHHTAPQWASAGVVIAQDGTEIILSHDVTFEVGKDYIMAFRKKDGTSTIPTEVVAGSAPNRVIPAVIPTSDIITDLNLDPTYYLLGVEEEDIKKGKVTSIRPNGDDTVTIELENYNPIIYSYDGVEAPEMDLPAPPTGGLPATPSVTISTIPTSVQEVNVSWTTDVNTFSYIIEVSYNSGTDWETHGNISASSTTIEIPGPATMTVRVAGVNSVGVGSYGYDSESVGVAGAPPGAMTGLALSSPFTGQFFTVEWDEIDLATDYRVILKDTSTGTTHLTETGVTTNSFSYTYLEQEGDGWNARDITVEVSAHNGMGYGTKQSLAIVNNPPPAISSITVTFISEDATTVTFKIDWPISNAPDLMTYRVWGSETSGFTPSGANLEYEGAISGFYLGIPKDGGGNTPDIYFRVAAVDVWDDDVNYSAEGHIPAT